MKDRYANRKYFIMALAIAAAAILIIRLFYIQIIDKTYRTSAANNVLRHITQYPARGLVYDRNGELIVYNQAAYDLLVVPVQTSAFDTARFIEILGIDMKDFRDRMKAAVSYSRRAPSVFMKMISSEAYGLLQEELYRFPGFYVQARTLRKYTKPVAAHLLGYVGEVDDKLIAQDSYYKSGDYIGVSGIEKSYEEQLRGRKGVNIFMVDVHNNIKGSYADGRFDTTSVPGKNLWSTIDLSLQEYGESLMRNKTGSIVAIEPSSGEILALVSSPSYDPSLLVGRVRSSNFNRLQADTIKPLFDRALMASYPPGSTFKIMNGLIGLEEGVIRPSTLFGCSMGYHAGSLTVGCHSHDSPLDLPGAVTNSCNAWFCNAFRSILENKEYNSVQEAYDRWREYLVAFGFGNKLGIDLPNELSGFIPARSYYDRYYGKDRWKALTVISLAIGQGEIGATPLQMANMATVIANRGSFYIPHIVKKIGEVGGPSSVFAQKYTTGISPENFEPIIEGMEGAVNGGPGATARGARLDSIIICGKTGTAQNPHGKDHSIFVAFAPKDNPQIAIAVYVENAGFGSTFAAPIASLMIEEYLTGKIKRKYLEDYVLKVVITPDGKEQ
ncbi:MAG: penicillin-binding protein 2 [Bacteroidales bacterium]|jgi:penicillin-binding protein 2|nr:penicillin-binding protein 2 [Bacteroidales bacterium]